MIHASSIEKPATGLDPHVRHVVWELIRTIRNRGKTILPGTDLIEEAKALCDRVAVFFHG